jgi:hypothetical protein
MSIDDDEVQDLIGKREAAERVVEGMQDGPRKEKAFEMVFQRLLDSHAQPEAPRRRRRGKQAQARPSAPLASTAAPRSRRASPRAHLDELLNEGFFDSRRRLPEIAEKLRTRGHIYRQESLSPHLLKMTRDKVLRREQEAREDRRAMWVYERGD